MSNTEHTSWAQNWQESQIINASDLNRYESIKELIDTTNTTVSGHTTQIITINTDISSIKSDITSMKSDIASNTNRLDNIIDLIYPIGSIYMTSDSTNPGKRWLNTKWISFAQGRTIFGIGDSSPFNNVLNEGGNISHTLNATEIPMHSHSYKYYTYAGTTDNECGKDGTKKYYIKSIAGTEISSVTSSWGEENPTSFSLLPPYITTYIWERVSLDSIFTVSPGLQYDLTTKIISWNYTAQTGATISFSINGTDYSSEMPTYLYDEESEDVTFYIKGTLSGSNPEIISATLPAKVPETETNTGDNTESSTNEGE